MATDAEGNEIVDEKPIDEKPADEKPVDEKPSDEKPEDEKPVERVVPEKYDLKISDGSLLSKDDLERIAADARKQGLTQEEAAARLSGEEAAMKKGADAFDKRQTDAMKAEHQRWIEAGKADPEIGGDKYKESAELAKRVVDKFATKELIEGLEKSGLGNYHEFVRFVSRIGRAMDSDKLIIGDSAKNDPKDIAERMYGGKKE